MKLCRFNEKGIAAVRELLPQIKIVDDLVRAEALVSATDLIEPIPALAVPSLTDAVQMDLA